MFSREVTTVHGRRVSYLRGGHGPNLLLLHGWPVTGSSFSLVMQELVDRFDVIAPDLPGFGESQTLEGRHNDSTMAGTVFGLLAALGIQRTTVGGVSMGARIALKMASIDQLQETVDRLVLNAPPIRHIEQMTPSQIHRFRTAQDNPVIRYGLYLTMKAFPGLFCQLVFGSALDLHNPIYTPIIRDVKKSSLRAPWQMLTEFTLTNARGYLPYVHQPTIVFVGEQDVQFKNPSREVARRVQHGRFIELPGDHWMAVQDPRQFAMQF